MPKVVINKCFGGFGLSDLALKKIQKLKGSEVVSSGYDLERDDPILVKVVEELGKKANGTFADLKVVNVPDGVKWQVEEYDGSEWVAEIHRSWS